MAEVTNDDIAAAAKAPRKAEGDGGSMESRPIDELIEAQKHVSAAAATKKRLGNIRLTKCIPPGAS